MNLGAAGAVSTTYLLSVGQAPVVSEAPDEAGRRGTFRNIVIEELNIDFAATQF